MKEIYIIKKCRRINLMLDYLHSTTSISLATRLQVVASKPAGDL